MNVMICGKAFVTTKELKKHSCVILDQDVYVKSTMAQSSIGSHLENSDVMKTESCGVRMLILILKT